MTVSLRSAPIRLIALVFATLAAIALPAGAETLVLQGGTVHTLTGEPIEATVVVTDGTIAAVGTDVTVPADARVIDVTGGHVYPGFFDALSQLGLVEINSISATVDTTELGGYNPHLQAATAIHPASEVLPVTRANGITHTVSAPEADGDSVIPGQGSLVSLDGWTVEEMAIVPGAAMLVNWPAIETRSFDFSTFSMVNKPYNEAKEAAEKKIAQLRQWLEAARHYARAEEAGSERLERDLKLEALAQVLDGDMPVVMIASAERDISAALDFAEEQGLRMIVAGGTEAWKIKERLAEMQVPVILGLVASLPGASDDPYDRAFRTAGELADAGVTIAFGSGAGGGFGPGGPHSSRTLPFEAGFAVPYGCLLYTSDAADELT